MNRRCRSSRAKPYADTDGLYRSPPARHAIEVLHHDDDLILVNRPAGTWLEGGPGEQTSVAEHLAAKGVIAKTGDELHCVTPPDIDASGLLVLARTTTLADHMRGQLVEGTLDLCHLAIVRGPVSQQSGTIDRRITERSRSGLACIDDRHGQPAITQWRLVECFIGLALLECRPRTAVQSQIRLHLESAGLPLAVDPTYGGADRLMLSSFKSGYRPSRRRPERPLIQRLTLHACSATFEHPRTGGPLRFEAPPPKDFRASLHQLAKYGRIPRA